MKITTGLEIVKENLLKNEMGTGYVQDAIDYIHFLEKRATIEIVEDNYEYVIKINGISRSVSKNCFNTIKEILEFY